MQLIQNRRDFLASASMAAAAGVLGARRPLADEGPPETATVRLPKFFPAACEIPEYLAEELLRADGLTDVRFVEGKAATRRSGSRAASWISTGITQRPTSPRSKPAFRSQWSRECTPGASS